MNTARLCFTLVPGTAALLVSSLLVNSESFAEDRCVCNLPESVECYWVWTPPAACSNAAPCSRSGGSSLDTCGGPGVRRNPWGAATASQAPAGITAYAVDSCSGSATAGGSMTDIGTGKLRHRSRCGNCRGRVNVTMTPSFNTCADAFDPPSNCKAYGLMQATGVPVPVGRSSGLIISAAGGAASGHPTPPTVQFSVGIGEQLVQVTLTQSASSPYSRVPVTNSDSRTWHPDVSWVDLTFVGSAVLEAFADGWFVPPLLLFDVGESAAHIPNRGHWNVDFVLECVGTCGRIQRFSWDKAPTPQCPPSLP